MAIGLLLPHVSNQSSADLSENRFQLRWCCPKKPVPQALSTWAPTRLFAKCELPEHVTSVAETSASAARHSQTRSIVLLAAAGFAAQAQVRVTDSLLPQIAADFHTTIGIAAIVVTTYVITHGLIQFIAGPIADRFGKYRVVAIASTIASVLVALCGLSTSLPMLALTRLATGAVAGWVIPISMAYVGDVTPYDRRQPVLARYASGYILGQLFGQAAGGVLGDWLGWRNVFFVLAAMFALAAAGLIFELIADPGTRAPADPSTPPRGFAADYKSVLGNPFARIVIIVGFVEAALAWGAFAYIGADLHARFGLSFTLIGITVAFFGIGGLIYAGSVRRLVAWLGPVGLIIGGGFVLAAAYVVLAVAHVWQVAPIATTVIGLGFYMFHNTLQTNATQMTPEARGTAVAIFSAALYMGQTAGVAVGALLIDRLGASPLFVITAIGFPLLALWFARTLRRQNGLPTA
jgi:MFS transporter, YNFM family, putative membrane transport protein